MEQEREPIIPPQDAPETEGGAISETSPAEVKDIPVHLTQEELDTLDELGPDNEAVKQWLEENGISENDRIVAYVEGRDDAMVLVADSEDFLTRDVAASEAWNEAAAAARRTIVGVEDEIDTRSAEISAEHEARLSEEEVREIGEEGLESAGVDNPAESDLETETAAEAEAEPTQEALASVEHTYQQQVLSLREELARTIATPLNNLESEAEAVKHGERTLLESTSVALEDLETTLRRYDDYPLGAIQTRLRGAIDNLHGVAGQAGRYGEGTVAEARRMLSAVDMAIALQEEQAQRTDEDVTSVLNGYGVEDAPFATDSAMSVVDTVKHTVGDLDMIRADLRVLDTETSEFRGGVMKAIGSLDAMLRESYSRPIDIDEVRHVVRVLKQSAAHDGTLAESIRKADTGLQATLQKIHAAYDTTRA